MRRLCRYRGQPLTTVIKEVVFHPYQWSALTWERVWALLSLTLNLQHINEPGPLYSKSSENPRSVKSAIFRRGFGSVLAENQGGTSISKAGNLNIRVICTERGKHFNNNSIGREQIKAKKILTPSWTGTERRERLKKRIQKNHIINILSC